MACQTGIKPNSKLRLAFENGKQAKLRLIKVVVRNEELAPNYELRGGSDWKEDWRAALPECLDNFEPCFVLFRLNTIHDWVFISFADDRAPVKEKMLLAATQATFKNEFGPSYIAHERHVTDRKDLRLEAFEDWLRSKNEAQPLTEIEQELMNAQQERANAVRSGPQAGMKGVNFPLDRNAQDALIQLASRQMAFVQLSVDTLNEAIKLERTETSLSADKVASCIPRDKPRYTFYRFEHEFEGRPLDNTFFIYSLPASGSSIKERMLYSSCKGPFLAEATRLGVDIAKKMEVDSKDDLSEQSLFESLHPAPTSSPVPFSRPAPPGGNRRITKV